MAGTVTRCALTLKKTALFSVLSDNELERLALSSVFRNFKKHQIIFSEGQACSGLYAIESGSVKIFKTSARGREQILSIEGAGATLAELPVFDGGSYPASAAAEVDSTLIFIGKREFRALCLEHPEAALKVLAVLGKRLRQLVDIIENLSFTTVRHRLATLLLREAKSKGSQTPRGTQFTLSVNNQQLSAQIGTVRELVSRTLSRLQADGIILMEGKTVTVPDLKALEAESEDNE